MARATVIWLIKLNTIEKSMYVIATSRASQRLPDQTKKRTVFSGERKVFSPRNQVKTIEMQKDLKKNGNGPKKPRPTEM